MGGKTKGIYYSQATHPLQSFVAPSKDEDEEEKKEHYSSSSSPYNPSTHPLNSVVISRATGSGDGTETKESENIRLLAEQLDKVIPYASYYTDQDYSQLPVDFEPQTNEWKEYMVPSENQGTCGSCWAFSSAGCYADRFNILSRRRFFEKSLTPLTLVLCNDLTNLIIEKNKNMYSDITNPFRINRESIQKQACYGNSIVTALYYLKFYGVPIQSCMPYNIDRFYADKLQYINFAFPANQGRFKQSDLNSAAYTELSNFQADRPCPSCFLYYAYSFQPFNFCYNNVVYNETLYYGSPAQNFTAFLIYKVHNGVKNIRNIMAEIFHWGPVTTSFFVYEDFYNFNPKTDGVYVHDPSFSVKTGGHAVEIVGWGEYKNPKKPKSKAIPFWWIKNSWGPQYGYNGYFRFLRGKNQCEVENNVICMMPNLFIDYKNRPSLQELNQKLRNLNIIRSNQSMETLFNLTSKIFFSYARYGKAINIETIRKNEKMFGYFFFEALYHVGITQINTTTISGFNTINMVVMPGLDYSNPSIDFPVDPAFRAGLYTTPISITTPLSNNNDRLGPLWPTLLLFIFGLLALCILILYLKK